MTGLITTHWTSKNSESYPAIEIYPKRNGARHEHMILTNAASRRIKRFFEYCRCKYGSLCVASKAFCGNERTLQFFAEARSGGGIWEVPTLGKYLKMMRFMKNPLSKHDLNYAYAHIKYTPEDIRRRVMRLSSLKKKGICDKYGYSMIASEIGRDRGMVTDSLQYLSRRSAQTYGIAMMWIAEQEKIRGYEDRMQFEK